MIGATIGSALIGGISANKAASSQKNAANNELQLQKSIYKDTTRKFEPFLDSGTNALAAYNFENGMGERPENYTGYNMSPGAQYQLTQGRDATEAGAVGRAGLFSGATVSALDAQRQGIVNQDYGNHLNRLQGMVGMGQASAGQQAAAGQNYATGAGNAYSDMGNAAAAGAIGVGNALQGGIQNGLGIYNYNQQMNS